MLIFKNILFDPPSFFLDVIVPAIAQKHGNQIGIHGSLEIENLVQNTQSIEYSLKVFEEVRDIELS